MNLKPFAVTILVLAALLVGCGDSDESASDSVDSAFVAQMIPHHESAIGMARTALDRAEHPEVERLAEKIIATQGDEIALMQRIQARLGTGAESSLGLSESEMGMNMDHSSLQNAKPFDLAFIDMMIVHHQGAVEMAQVELDRGSDPETMALAEAIIAAQADEIEQMSAWRDDWYEGSANSDGDIDGLGGPAEEMAHPMAHG